MSPLRIGIVGGGNIGRVHAKALRSLDERVAAVADVDADARSSFAVEFDVPATYDDYETMIEAEPLDLVVVAVPNAIHAECAVTALAADLDVFVEKPLAHSLEAAERIAAAERTSDGRVVVGFVRTFEPWVDHVRAEIVDGAFGRVYDVDATCVRRRGIPQLGSWFTSKEAAGGGALIDVGVHVLHVTLHLLGFPEVETVSATVGGYFGTKANYTYLQMWGGDPVGDGAFDVDDHARVFVRTADGTTIHLHLAWAINDVSRQSIRIHGDVGGATIDADRGFRRPRIYSTDGDGLADVELRLPERDRFVAQWEYVTAAVRGEREWTYNTIEEGLIVQRLVDAIYESAEKGREVVPTANR